MRSKTRILMLCLVAVIASPLATAATLVVVKSEVVRYDDIRLISAVGAAVLYGRLRNAAERACGGPVENQQLARKQRYRTCVDDAVAQAVADVNHPVLTTYVESRRGKSASDRTSDPNATNVAKTP